MIINYFDLQRWLEHDVFHILSYYHHLTLSLLETHFYSQGFEPPTKQRSKFPSAVGKCRAFYRGMSMFFSICLGKRNAEAIEFLGILKKVLFQELKKYMFLLKEKKCLLNKKNYFYFLHNFQTFLIQIIYYIIHICLFSLFIHLFFSYTSFSDTGDR